MLKVYVVNKKTMRTVGDEHFIPCEERIFMLLNKILELMEHLRPGQCIVIEPET